MIFITSIYSLTIFIKYYLLPDQQRFLIALQFLHLSYLLLLFLLFKESIYKNYKTFLIGLLILTHIPNFLFLKPDAFYNELNQRHVKHFIYPTTFLGEISNNYKTLIIKDADYYKKKGSEEMIKLTELTYGQNVYNELKIEKDIKFKYKFKPGFEDKNAIIPLWDRSKLRIHFI